MGQTLPEGIDLNTVTLEQLNELAGKSEAETVYAEELAAEPVASTYPNVHAFITHLVTLGDASLPAAAVAEELSKIVTRPARAARATGSGERRGQLHGLTLAEMTDAQLKREKINSDSVLYKAIKRGAAAETIAANQARVDAVKAERAKRAPEVAATETAPVEPAVEASITAEV